VKHTYQVLLKERAGLAINAAPVQFGVPLPRGLYFNPKELVLVFDDNTVLLANITAAALWPDNSIKWCLVKTQVSLNANEQLKLGITRRTHKRSTVQCTPACVSVKGSNITIKTKNCEFSLNTQTFDFFDQVIKDGHGLHNQGFCTLNTKHHGTPVARILTYRYQTDASDECPLSIQVTFNGQFRSDEKELIANFTARLIFFTKTDTVKCTITLHNPRAAKHYSGKWDLGDPNSLFINSFNIGLNLSGTNDLQFKVDTNSPWQKPESHDLSIYQESSGGEHWDCPNHKNRFSKVPLKLNGFECKSLNRIINTGKRASPSLSIDTGHGNVNAFIENFWQNCPKSLHIDNRKMTIGLFPDQYQDTFELQAGERKTHSFYLNFSDDKNTLAGFENLPEVTLNPQWVEATRVFPYFDSANTDDALLNVINEGLTSKDNFFAKREIIDEYGWRNFGDIYADHETDGFKGNDTFVSHYNNQYDPIYGFLRQYTLSGEHDWFTLADDLACHVSDIDIYHTQFDKAEYNGGLFWHTDHCLDAATSTHRSYSKDQESDAYVDHAGGGGPGGQHCYTAGLLYHYLLTGNESSKLAIMQLADWITHVYEYERSGSIFDVLLAVKNRHRIDLKNILTGKYPLDRGTGNYINALLDKFELTQEQDAIKQVEHIIKNTVHPLDDIHSRDLKNVEINWYYTVFLQSTYRYLQVKEELSQLDETFYYVRDTLLHYADWMADNEYPYLTKPDILEFPNHTWTAQDIRKVNVLLMADYYAPANKTGYLNKAKEIYQYITDNLSTETTRTYTRILAILMQNHGAVTYYERLDTKPDFIDVGHYKSPDKATGPKSLWNITLALLNVIRHFSIKKEIVWLARHSGKVARLFRYQP